MIVFASLGGILGIIMILSVVLACCFANQIAKFEDEDNFYNHYQHQDDDELLHHVNPRNTNSRPATPRSTDVFKQGETRC